MHIIFDAFKNEQIFCGIYEVNSISLLSINALKNVLLWIKTTAALTQDFYFFPPLRWAF